MYPKPLAPGLELVRRAGVVVFVSWDPALALCVSGAASGVVVTRVVALASVDDKDRGCVESHYGCLAVEPIR